MPFIRTYAGAQMDVGSNIVGNLTVSPLISTIYNPGHDTQPQRPQVGVFAVQGVIREATNGSWVPVPDNTVRVITRLTIPIRYEWVLPNGELTVLADGELLFNDRSLWNSWCNDARIQVTPNTLRGMVAFGLVRNPNAPTNPQPGDPETPLPNPVAPPHETPGNSVPGAITSASTAIIIVALLGAAIYFLPHTGGK